MKNSVIRRIAQLEVKSAAPCPEPKDHEYCRFEERPGPAPAGALDSACDAKNGVRQIDIHLVRSPSDTEPEEHHWAELTALCRRRAYEESNAAN